MTAKKKQGGEAYPLFRKDSNDARAIRGYGDGRGGHGLSLVVTERAKGGVAKSWIIPRASK